MYKELLASSNLDDLYKSAIAANASYTMINASYEDNTNNYLNDISNYINHLLADIMTRYLYKITKECASDPSLSAENYGLCYNQKKFQLDI